MYSLKNIKSTELYGATFDPTVLQYDNIITQYIILYTAHTPFKFHNAL